jgi:hypothetical protein
LATNNKDFVVKNGLIVGDSTNLVNYTAASPSNPFIGQLWINEPYLYAWSSASTWVLVGDGNTGGGGGGGSASGTPFNIPNTLVSRSASGSFQTGAIDFHTASPVISAVGRMSWDSGEGTVSLGLSGGNVDLQLGQEEVALCYNGTGSVLSEGQVVRIVGVQGQRPEIALATAMTEVGSSKTFGVVTETIPDGQEGYVATFGIVQNLNTSSFSEGDALWLSASAGKFTNIMPIQPYHNVFIGYCLKSAPSSGRVFVKIQNGYEINELHNVLITSLSDKQILSYNQSASLWINKNLATAITEVDGPGSGIDSDLFHGFEPAFFVNTSSAVQEKTGNFTFHGTLTVDNLVISGSALTISTTNVALEDSIIQLALSQFNSDGVDIGFVGSYGDGSTSSANHYHVSFARDASQNKWKLLSKSPAPVNNVIDYSDPSIEFGVLQIAALEVSSSVTVTNFNADMLDNFHADHFLAAGTASSTYLTKANASATYVTKEDFNNLKIATIMGIY